MTEDKKIHMSDIYILGIESSCDDTSAAVLRNGVILSNVTASQEVHKAYGGVVPELASRAHQQNVVPVVDQAIKRAGITKEQLSAVAFTRGPGLMGSLLVGVSFAKGFARALGIPLIDVNHLQGHVMAHFIKENEEDTNVPPFPFVCLLVSGGNSQIVKVNAYNDMEVLGQTIDDAAGEAIDKCSKVMGLGYPGGPIIDKLARQGQPESLPVFRAPHSRIRLLLLGTEDVLPLQPAQVGGRGCRLCGASQGGPGSQPGVYGSRYSDEETAPGRQGDGHQACSRSGWRICQHRPAQRLPRLCQAIRMDHLHPQVQLHDGQCGHDSLCGYVQVP